LPIQRLTDTAVGVLTKFPAAEGLKLNVEVGAHLKAISSLPAEAFNLNITAYTIGDAANHTIEETGTTATESIQLMEELNGLLAALTKNSFSSFELGVFLQHKSEISFETVEKEVTLSSNVVVSQIV